MTKQRLFASREDFRVWLEENCQNSEGIWLRAGTPQQDSEDHRQTKPESKADVGV